MSQEWLVKSGKMKEIVDAVDHTDAMKKAILKFFEYSNKDSRDLGIIISATPFKDVRVLRRNKWIACSEFILEELATEGKIVWQKRDKL